MKLFLNSLKLTIPGVATLARGGGVDDAFTATMVSRMVNDSKNDRFNLDRKIKETRWIEGTVFNSDMSGFTRLTKKHGILHFLAMIVKMRSMVGPIISGSNGRILHYDADNVIAFFPTPQDGATAAFSIQSMLREYNT